MTLTITDITLQFLLNALSADVTRSQNIKVELLTSRTKTKIPVVVLTHPNAKYTILYSHGNATDCGAMLPMYKMICEFLKVNVVGKYAWSVCI